MNSDQPDSAIELPIVEKVHTSIRGFFAGYLPSLSSFPLVLAVSGGPDSMCMADAIITLQSVLHVMPHIAHLNHGLRGQAALDDANFVRAFATGRGIPCHIAESNVARISLEQRISIEEAARIARYTFLATVATSSQASHIAVAHNADDQVETVLLRLIRGTGITGLRGMQAIAPLKADYHAGDDGIMLLRPLLSIPRSEIEAYCAARNLSPRHDRTNDERHHLRNSIRHDLLPLLEQYNPGIRKVIMRLATTATADIEIVNDATRQALDQIRIQNAHNEIIDRSSWRKLPVSLQRATLREALLQFNGDLTHVKFVGIEEARKVLSSSAVSAEIAILATVRIIVTQDRFWFRRTAGSLL